MFSERFLPFFSVFDAPIHGRQTPWLKDMRVSVEDLVETMVHACIFGSMIQLRHSSIS
jgi:hypothetical protein